MLEFGNEGKEEQVKSGRVLHTGDFPLKWKYYRAKRMLTEVNDGYRGKNEDQSVKGDFF